MRRNIQALAAAVVIAAASLSLPSPAQAQKGTEGPHAPGVHLKKHKEARSVHQQSTWYMPPPTWKQFSTFPQGEPDYQYNYNGSNGGP